MPRETSNNRKMQLAIILALIPAIAGIIIALIQNEVFSFLAPSTATPTSTSTFTPTPTNTFTPSPTSTITATSTPTPTPTLVLSPLQGIFPDVDNGVAFFFPDNQPELISAIVVDEGDCVYSSPYGLRLVYGSTGGKGWGVHWNSAPTYHFDAREKYALRFLVKGLLGGETFQIGMKDTTGKEIKLSSQTYVLVKASEWREVIVPLEHFSARDFTLNLSSLNNISISFDPPQGSGSLCLDDFAFIGK